MKGHRLPHDLHVLAQDVSNRWLTPDARTIAYLAAAEAIRAFIVRNTRRVEC